MSAIYQYRVKISFCLNVSGCQHGINIYLKINYILTNINFFGGTLPPDQMMPHVVPNRDIFFVGGQILHCFTVDAPNMVMETDILCEKIIF